jgi:hypothetical protein
VISIGPPQSYSYLKSDHLIHARRPGRDEVNQNL